MENKFEFAKEYLCEWKPSESYQMAYKLWIKYHYECERYDEFVCTGERDKSGFISPKDSHEQALINRFASEKMNEVITMVKKYGISNEEWLNAKREVSRLNLNGLVSEYDRLYLNQR